MKQEEDESPEDQKEMFTGLDDLDDDAIDSDENINDPTQEG